MPRIVIIAAIDRCRGLGRDGAMAWHIPEELALFRTLTMDAPVILGHTTYRSLPRRSSTTAPLPGRHLIVLSRSPRDLAPGVEQATSIPQAIAKARHAATVWIAGGADIYRQALPMADEVRLSVVDRIFESDVRFPELAPDLWRLEDDQSYAASIPFHAQKYTRLSDT